MKIAGVDEAGRGPIAGPVYAAAVILNPEKAIPDMDIEMRAIIKADDKFKEVMAASILAKYHRDNYMINLDKKFPEYSFKNHKGYPTKQHLEAIELKGICVHHRKTFKPILKYL